MKKYLAPKIRFMRTQLSESIAAACWGGNGSDNQVTVGYKRMIYVIYEVGNNWGECKTQGVPPNLLYLIRTTIFTGYLDDETAAEFSNTSQEVHGDNWRIWGYNDS